MCLGFRVLGLRFRSPNKYGANFGPMGPSVACLCENVGSRGRKIICFRDIGFRVCYTDVGVRRFRVFGCVFQLLRKEVERKEYHMRGPHVACL